MSTIKRIDNSQIAETELTDKIVALVEAAQVTGLAVSIFNENEVVYNQTFGYANFEKQEPLLSEHVFYGASFSKAVFGYLVAQLAVEGVLDLDKPLQEYLEKPLPDYEFEKERRGYANLKEDKRYEKLTARMCMNHTTGFPNWRWMTKEFDFFREGKIRFIIEPGTRYSYSGEGIKLLQFVIEQHLGKGLEELARERIFDPLQMNSTSYVWQERFENKYCLGHSADQKLIPKNKRSNANAAGSLETTPADYAKFISKILQLTKNNSSIANLLFTPSVRINSKFQFGAASWENSNENDDIALSYGLGWGLLTSPHGPGMFKEGHDEGFQHYSIIFPDQQMGMVIMSNSDNAENIFKYLLELGIGDVYTPWKWERYIPFDQ